MSPDITPEVRPNASAAQIEIIRKAVNAARAAGLTVSTVPDLGVLCVSTHAPSWTVDQRVSAISPLGAVLLALQPPIPDADKALAHALEANPIWVIGFDDGCGTGRESKAIVTGNPAMLYSQGFAAGLEFRAIMHRRAGVPVERPLGQDTEPMALDTPRSVIAELIGSLTVAQTLEALADSIPARGMTMDDAAEAVELLRELAEEFRKDEV